MQYHKERYFQCLQLEGRFGPPLLLCNLSHAAKYKKIKNYKWHTRSNHRHMHIKMKHRAGHLFIKGDIFFTSHTKEKEQATNFPTNSK